MRIYAPLFPPRTIRGRISLALNATLIGLFVLFLAYDYRHDSADRLERKRTALEEQARIVMPGIQNLTPGNEIVARLEEIRRQMSESHSDSHMVAAETNEAFFQSGLPAYPGDAPARFRTSREDGTGALELGGKDFLVGSHREGATTIYIAEDLREVRAAIRADMGRHLVSVVIALVCMTLIINVVLWLALHRPLAALTTAVGEIGAGKLGLQIDPVGTEELDVLAAAVHEMSRALAAAEDARSAQMRKALAVQESLLPARMLIDGVVIARHFQPAEAVGGDYCDLLMLPDGSGLLCVADVSGHGVSAALVAAMVKVCLLDAAEHGCDPGTILGFVDRRLSTLNIPDTFVSMILIRLGGAKRDDLEFAGAGHPPALLIGRDGRCRELESDGPLLGLGTGFGWDTRREPFSPGDRLVLYTDGVTEASGLEPGLFGLERLKEVIVTSLQVAPVNAVERVVEAVIAHFAGQPAQDDITLVIVDRSPD